LITLIIISSISAVHIFSVRHKTDILVCWFSIGGIFSDWFQEPRVWLELHTWLHCWR